MQENAQIAELTQRFGEELERSKISIIKQLLPMFDTLQKDRKYAKLAENTLALIDVRQPQYKLFDPKYHECVGVTSDAKKQDQWVQKVVRRGWFVGDSILEYAEVIVNERD